MKNMPAILFFILFSLTAFSQRTIKGRVVNASTGAVIPGSSVFITNTSRGTVSDNAGNFQINDVPAGKHELVVSSIGYETNVFSFSDNQLPLQLKVELSIKVKELENINLEPFVEEGWDKWGHYFTEHFVGSTESAARCKIKNENAIRFRFYKKSNRLVAFADEPVILENKTLGYNITYQLEDFQVNFSERSLSFIGYSLFEDIGKEGKASLGNKYEKRREEAYRGSVLHFMRSLYNNRLKEEGFEVRRMKRLPNLEKQRVKGIYAPAKMVRTNRATGQMTEEWSLDESIPKDSASYYQKILSQPDAAEIYGTNLLTADSLISLVKDEIKFLEFEDYLFITYLNEKEEPGYLRTQFPARKVMHQRSTVILVNQGMVAIEKNGNYYDPRNFFTSGYWSWSEKMGDSLPLDYEPSK